MVFGVAAWSVALALAETASVSTLVGPTAAEFTWDAPAGCPAEKTVRSQVEARLGGSIDDASGRISVIARVRAEGEGYGMRLWAVAPDGTHERELWHEDCDVLANATSVIVAIAIDPMMEQQVEIQRPTEMVLGGDLGLGPRSDCTPGEERCACGSLGACGEGLSCLSRMCVRAPDYVPPPVVSPATRNNDAFNARIAQQHRRTRTLLVTGYISWLSGVGFAAMVGGFGLSEYLDDDTNTSARSTTIAGFTIGGALIAAGVTMTVLGYRSMPDNEPDKGTRVLSFAPIHWAH